jgi:hypothetical protein
MTVFSSSMFYATFFPFDIANKRCLSVKSLEVAVSSMTERKIMRSTVYITEVSCELASVEMFALGLGV